MGIDRDEISPSTRASMDGQVPADKSFSEYLKDPDSSLDPEKILGKTRAKLWREGDLDLNDFLRGGVSNKNVMNLDELRQRHGEAFEAIQ